MSIEQTLSIIKPDAAHRNVIGLIYQRFEAAGLRIVAARMTQLDKQQAGRFYAVHKQQPFFDELVAYMCSGPIMVQVLEGEDAVQKNRALMGATDPSKASIGTIRADFAESISENAVHGSDSAENAATEIRLFFDDKEIYPAGANG